MKINSDPHQLYNQTLYDFLLEQLSRFRETVSLKTVQLETHQWTYYAEGNPDNEAILLLSGGGADAEAMFGYISQFSGHFRVIAPNIPATIKQLAEATSGLHGLLAQEGIHRVIVVGISFGAILAQLYIRLFQDSVSDLIISQSLIPSKHLAETSCMQTDFMRLYPAPLLMWMSKQAYRNQLANSITPANEATRHFWQAYFDEIYSKRIGKQDLLSRASLTAQYHSEHEFNSRDLLNWHGEILIIESEQDDVIHEGDRGSLKAMYTRAYVQTLYGYDHLAPLLAAEELISSIINFLLKED